MKISISEFVSGRADDKLNFDRFIFT